MTSLQEAWSARYGDNHPMTVAKLYETAGLPQPAARSLTPAVNAVRKEHTAKTNRKASTMSAVVFPDLPTELVNSEDDSVGFFIDMITSSHDKLTKLTGDYERVRESEANAEEALENSDSENAQAWRESQEDATQALETIAEQEKAAIAEIRKANKAKVKEINDALNAERKTRVESETGALLEDIDLDELRQKYSTALAAHVKAVKLVKDEVPQVVDYLKSLPSEVRQAKGNSRSSSGNNASGERGPTPRFVFVAVDGQQVSGAQTFSTAVKVLGIKASEGGRRLLADRLQGQVVSFDNVSFDVDNPTEFTVTTADGVVHTIAVVGKAKSSDTEEDSAAA